MKDKFGKELNVNDEVVYADAYWGLMKGTVIKRTPKTIIIKADGNSNFNGYADSQIEGESTFSVSFIPKKVMKL